MPSQKVNLRKHRLLRSSDFDHLRESGHSKNLRPWLRMFYRARGEGPLKFGVSLSRKVGSAVTRNRIKRWTRELVRHQLSGPDRLEGCEFHLIFRAPTPVFFKELSFESYESALADAFRHLEKVRGSRPDPR